MESKKIRLDQIGDIPVEVCSDYVDGEYLDTEVKTECGTLCCISGKDRFKFIEEINAVINKYRI
jgi:hypothetical protein